ncbi:hypothetical protein FRC07_001203 [Ceratobasidium sp. 392]|nr:hypothetical protein FRC07_001203 [Ceratobasidium sp. 392]
MSSDAPQRVVIALCGATGTGKSTFINDASGANLPVGDMGVSCTEFVTLAPTFLLDGREIQLIDTPGFDHTSISEAEVLERIGQFLKQTSKNVLLLGTIYMHRISDNRVGGVSRRLFRVFRELCGPDALKYLIIVTNIWHNPPEDIEQIELRENEQFFKPILDEGAQMTRYVRSQGPQAAHDTIRKLIPNKPAALRFEESLDNAVSLGENNAGKVLEGKKQKLMEKHKAEIDTLRQEMQRTLAQRDEEVKKELEAQRKQANERLDALTNQIQDLRGELRDNGEREERTRRFKEESQRSWEDTTRIKSLTATSRRVLQEKKTAELEERVNDLQKKHAQQANEKIRMLEPEKKVSRAEVDSSRRPKSSLRRMSPRRNRGTRKLNGTENWAQQQDTGTRTQAA